MLIRITRILVCYTRIYNKLLLLLIFFYSIQYLIILNYLNSDRIEKCIGVSQR